MKKVFLSLALVAVLTVVSCKKTEEAPAETAVETPAVEATEATAANVDTTKAAAATATEAAATATEAAATSTEAAKTSTDAAKTATKAAAKK